MVIWARFIVTATPRAFSGSSSLLCEGLLDEWARTNVKLTGNYTWQLQRGSLWGPRQAWEAYPPTSEMWAEAAGSDKPDSEKREAGGQWAGEESTTSKLIKSQQIELPKMSTGWFLNYADLCKFYANQPHKGGREHLLTAWLWSLLVSQPQPPSGNTGAVTRRPARRKGQGLPYPSFLPHLPSGDALPKVRPSDQPSTPGFCPGLPVQRCH